MPSVRRKPRGWINPGRPRRLVLVLPLPRTIGSNGIRPSANLSRQSGIRVQPMYGARDAGIRPSPGYRWSSGRVLFGGKACAERRRDSKTKRIIKARDKLLRRSARSKPIIRVMAPGQHLPSTTRAG